MFHLAIWTCNMIQDNAMMLNIINNTGDGDTYYTLNIKLVISSKQIS